MIAFHKQKRTANPHCALFALTISIFASPSVMAFNWQPTELTFYLLPDYCKAKISGFHRNRKGTWDVRLPINEKEIKRWKEIVGPDWPGLHHYCAGLSYFSAPKPNYRSAAREINYSRQRSQPGAPLWADMSINYARAIQGTGDHAAAIKILRDLQKHEPTNIDVYVALGATLKRAGKLKQAIAVLEEGVKQAANKRPALFWLAHYYHESGDINRAAELTVLAEQAGMKMDSLREKLGPAMNRVDAAAGN